MNLPILLLCLIPIGLFCFGLIKIIRSDRTAFRTGTSSLSYPKYKPTRTSWMEDLAEREERHQRHWTEDMPDHEERPKRHWTEYLNNDNESKDRDDDWEWERQDDFGDSWDHEED